MTEVVPNPRRQRRVHLTLAGDLGGTLTLRASYTPPASGVAAILLNSRGMLATDPVEIAIPTVTLPPAAPVLGTIVLTQQATLAISAGTRRLTVTTPPEWAVRPGDDLIACPVSVPAGYAVHDVFVVEANRISVGIIAPLLAIGASFLISCRIRRFT